MKLLNAKFENYRLLRDLYIDFSTDTQKKLTVFRAENETGKTTILTALQWALYGDEALPDKGKDYRLHPIDWDVSSSSRVPISVTAEFESITQRRTSSGIGENRRRFRMVRSVTEEIDGVSWKRGASNVNLYFLTEQGAELLDNPESYINDELPPDLREVFFTDGDRALSFIESDVSISTVRQRVQKAIRSLLGLEVIENSLKHLKQVGADVNRKAQRLQGTDIQDISQKIDRIGNEISEIENKLEDAREQFSTFDVKYNETDKKIAEALQMGDKDELRKEIAGTKSKLSKIDDQIKKANKEHTDLFKNKILARDLLHSVFSNASEILNSLHEERKIPNATLPVLEERLKENICICGETLDLDSSDGKRRREHIQHLIDDSKKADAVQNILTDLYYGSDELLTKTIRGENDWISEYEQVFTNRDNLQNLRDEEGRRMKSLELKLDELPDTDIQGLRETKRYYLEQRDRFSSALSKYETELSSRRRELDNLTQERDRILREQDKGIRILSELDVVQDLEKVLKDSYKQITDEELGKVSELMNDIFLEMIGADPEQGAIIKKATISEEFDIVVYGTNDRKLNPDRDLNGASRRALTLAFILALTKVSEVEAPNIIDTPLGMMSGYVKKSVLKTTIRESKQLILFLTRSEIAGCEEILDEFAGNVTTLTNVAHYPTMLVNDPGVDTQKVISCNCNHREECNLCARHAESLL